MNMAGPSCLVRPKPPKNVNWQLKPDISKWLCHIIHTRPAIELVTRETSVKTREFDYLISSIMQPGRRKATFRLTHERGYRSNPDNRANPVDTSRDRVRTHAQRDCSGRLMGACGGQNNQPLVRRDTISEPVGKNQEGTIL